MAPYEPYIDLKSAPAYQVYDRNGSSASSSPNEQSSNSASSSPDDSPPRPSSLRKISPPDKSSRRADITPPPPVYTNSVPNSRSSRRSPKTAVLGAIDENGGMAPDVPVRSQRRHNGAGAATKAFWSALIFSPDSNGHRFSRITPPENEYDKLTGPNGEKLGDVRKNRYTAKPKGIIRRNGWKAWACIGLVAVIIIAALAIGLGVGLARKKHNNDTNTSPSTDEPAALTGFPIGTWTVTTFLSTVATLCTPNSATWRCYPYQTYNQSQSGAMTMLDWQIIGTNSSSDQVSYTIQSSANPFALPFNSTALKLVDQGTDNEAWTFEALTTKLVVPDAVLTSDGSTAQCVYNSTSLSAKLYTKRSKSYPASLSGNTTSTSNSDNGWPYAVEVSQLSSEPPTCYKTNNGAQGDQISLNVNANARYGACECTYMNYGT